MQRSNTDDLTQGLILEAEAEAEAELGPSKSQRKREQQALHALAEQLTRLPKAQLRELGFGPDTWVAIEETARIKDQRALRRHYKRIANCLMRENTQPLKELLELRERHARQDSMRHHQTESWRARLIAEGDAALTEFLDAHPETDRQQLRTLIRAAQRDTERGRPDAPRKLFRFLRPLIDAQ